MPGNIAGRRAVQRRIERSIDVVPIYQLRCRSGFLDTAHTDERDVLEAPDFPNQPSLEMLIETSAPAVDEVWEDGRSR